MTPNAISLTFLGLLHFKLEIPMISGQTGGKMDTLTLLDVSPHVVAHVDGVAADGVEHSVV